METNLEENVFAEVFGQKPQGFSDTLQVAACYLEIEGCLLLLQCAPPKQEAGRWSVPAGKLEKGEEPKDAAQRELFEETAIRLEQDAFHALGKLYVRKPGIEFVYHLFQVRLEEKPEIILSSEHSASLWANQEDRKNLPLMAGAKEALEKYNAAISKKKGMVHVASYLILRSQEKVFLKLRKNTGYLDGKWSLISGHVEDYESASQAMIREAKEEVGIEIAPKDLKVVHILHRKTNRLSIDIFFECFEWQGVLENKEPHKCEEMQFFPLHTLPANLADYHAAVLAFVEDKQFYSEMGWEC